MESKKAQKLIDKIIADLNHAGIIINTLIADLKELRPYALAEQNPLVTKLIRLTYEHIEENETFDIPIPEDDPLDESESENSEEDEEIVHDPVASIAYLVSLFKDPENKINILDLKAYRNALNDY